jgi:protein-disulfide isomerase
MKTINTLILVLLLSGCSLAKYWPVPHDPALAQAYVNVQVSIKNISCADKSQGWKTALDQANWLQEYAGFRSDIQLESVTAVQVNLNKAFNTESIKACEIWVNLSKSRMQVLNKAWSGR